MRDGSAGLGNGTRQEPPPEARPGAGKTPQWSAERRPRSDEERGTMLWTRLSALRSLILAREEGLSPRQRGGTTAPPRRKEQGR